LPTANVALIVLLTEDPATTETLPELLSVKSKSLVLANHALATALGSTLFLNALALSSTLLEMVTGDVYWVDDCVGVDPSTV
jgi:hypothetical protein